MFAQPSPAGATLICSVPSVVAATCSSSCRSVGKSKTSVSGRESSPRRRDSCARNSTAPSESNPASISGVSAVAAGTVSCATSRTAASRSSRAWELEWAALHAAVMVGESSDGRCGLSAAWRSVRRCAAVELCGAGVVGCDGAAASSTSGQRGTDPAVGISPSCRAYVRVPEEPTSRR